MKINTEEALALAVLRGDLGAAAALADCLVDRLQGVTRKVLPSKNLAVDRGKLRLVFITHESLGADVEVDKPGLLEAVNNWLDHGENLVLCGLSMEVYELSQEGAAT